MSDLVAALSIVVSVVFFAGLVVVGMLLLDVRRNEAHEAAKWERHLNVVDGYIRVGIARVGRWGWTTTRLDYQEVARVELGVGCAERFMQILSRADSMARDLNEFMEFGRRQ